MVELCTHVTMFRRKAERSNVFHRRIPVHGLESGSHDEKKKNESGSDVNYKILHIFNCSKYLLSN